MQNQEIWKDIEDYDGDYQISTLGNTKSFKCGKERILKPGINGGGYQQVNLNNGSQKSHQVHILVAIAFLGHTPSGYTLVVDHRDFDKLNNNVSNLRIITQRENSNKKHKESSSKFTGVSWDKIMQKWKAYIRVCGKLNHLGYFINENDAASAYNDALKQITQLYMIGFVVTSWLMVTI